MPQTALVVGLGIGQLYVQQLSALGYTVTTVDSNPTKNPNFTSLTDALTQVYDVAHVCTPNFTHYALACKIAPFAKILFVEKPGCKTLDKWTQLCSLFPLYPSHRSSLSFPYPFR